MPVPARNDTETVARNIPAERLTGFRGNASDRPTDGNANGIVSETGRPLTEKAARKIGRPFCTAAIPDVLAHDGNPVPAAVRRHPPTPWSGFRPGRPTLTVQRRNERTWAEIHSVSGSACIAQAPAFSTIVPFCSVATRRS